MAKGKLEAAVDELVPVMANLRSALEAKGAVVGNAGLKDIPGIINTMSVGRPLTAITIKDFHGESPTWKNTDAARKLELASITPEDATVEIRAADTVHLQWFSSDENVVRIIERDDGVYAEVVEEGEATITADLLGVRDSFTVTTEMEGGFYAVRSAVRNGVGATLYPVGTELPDTWEDTAAQRSYDAPLIVAHHGLMPMADGTIKTAAVLVRKYTTPFTMQFDAVESSGAGNNRNSYGYNRYSQSGIHQWLNSDATKNNWWSAQNQYDRAPDIASTKDGYLKGCSKELLDVIADVKVSVSTNTVSDGGVTDQVECKFFLPSREEVYGIPGASNAAAAGVEGTAWDYFSRMAASATDSALSGRIFKNNSNQAQYCWLRSADRGLAIYEWYVYPDGSLSTNLAYSAYACAPACVIA